MYKIDNETAVAVMPTPAAPGPKPDAYFVANTFITEDWLNALQDEVCNVITEAGISLNKSSYTQFHEAILELIDSSGPYPYITAIEEDLDPHLGGDLDTNSFDITDSVNSIVGLSANGTGYLIFNTDVFYVQKLLHAGDTNTFLNLSSTGMEENAGGVNIFDITSAGIRLGGANARVNAILNESNMSSNSATALSTQGAAKSYVDAKLFDYSLAELFITSANLPSSGGTVTRRGWLLDVGATGANNVFVVKKAGTLRRLYGHADWVINDSNIPTSIDVTLQVNGVNTALTLNLGKLILDDVDISNTVNVVPGDLLRFEFTYGALTETESSSIHLSLLLT